MSVDEQEEKLNIHLSKLIRHTELATITAIILLCETGCGNLPPTCIDNPRNISCLTPTQLEKELNK